MAALSYFHALNEPVVIEENMMKALRDPVKCGSPLQISYVQRVKMIPDHLLDVKSDLLSRWLLTILSTLSMEDTFRFYGSLGDYLSAHCICFVV
jgi:hypothetical protein